MPLVQRTTVRTTTSHPTAPVTIKTNRSGVTEVTMDFRAACAAARGKAEHLVGSTPFADIYVSRIDLGDKFELTNKRLPPYEVIIKPKTGGRDDLSIHRDTGSSSWSTRFGGSGQLISAGTETIKFVTDAGKTAGSLRFTLDAVNDYQRLPPKAASAHSKPFREAWKKNWFARDTAFSFDKGLANGSLKKATVAELRALKDGKKIEKVIEEGGGEINNFVKRGTVHIAKDAATGSLAVICYTEGEIEHSLYVFDKAGKAVGEWSVDGDGQAGWIEY